MNIETFLLLQKARIGFAGTGHALGPKKPAAE